MSNDFIISVVIAAYNCRLTIGRAIESVLAQSRRADEILVVDDGSTDATAAAVLAYAPRVRLICQSNGGAAAARNTGILAAAGQWVGFLDADDVWQPDYLKAQTDLLGRNPHLVWTTANYETADLTTGRRVPYVDPKAITAFLGGRDFAEDFFAGYRLGLVGHTDTMLIRRDVLLSAGLFMPDLRVAEDIDLWWKIAYRHPQIGYIAEPLAVYHVSSPDSLTKKAADVGLFAGFIRRHLQLAAQYGRAGVVRPALASMLRLWIRGLLFEGRGRDIRTLLNEFWALVPAWYRCWMGLMTVCPAMTAWCCRLISRVVRAFGLRRRVVAAPN